MVFHARNLISHLNLVGVFFLQTIQNAKQSSKQRVQNAKIVSNFPTQAKRENRSLCDKARGDQGTKEGGKTNQTLQKKNKIPSHSFAPLLNVFLAFQWGT